MKTIYKYIAALIVTVLISSCTAFLEVDPTDFVSPGNYFNTEKEADLAIAGVYLRLNTLYGGPFKGSLFATTDEVLYTRLAGNALLEKTHSASTTEIYNMWNLLYQGVYYANFFLENIDKVAISDEKKNSLRAEALFLRGYYYYHLTMLWGDVPLRLKAISSPLGTECARSTRADVFKQICEDMKYGTEHLYSYKDQKGAPVRVCQEAATGVLARVYLSMAGVLNKPEYYSKAREILFPLVEGGKMQLNPDYTQIWKNISADTYDHDYKEIMFDVDFVADATKYLYGGWAGSTSHAAPASDNEAAGYNLDWYKVAVGLWNYYQSDTNDVRYTWNICDYRIELNGNRLAKPAYEANGSNVSERNAGKFRRDWEKDLPRDKNRNGSNFPILRYSDVLLMLAEAENEINGPTDLALWSLDLVRSRANAFTYSDLPDKPTTDEFKEIIKAERSRELCFESSTRYYDLIRWGDLLSRFGEMGDIYKGFNTKTSINYADKLYYALKPHMLLLPIPADEIQLNPLCTQNEGW